MPDLFDRDSVQQFINQKHIKNVIRKNGLNRRFNKSEIIHAAIGFNPNNLVHGPNKTFRANDPADDSKSIKIF